MFRFIFGTQFAEPFIGFGRGRGGRSFFRRFSGPILMFTIIAVGFIVIIGVAGLVLFSTRQSNELPTISILQPQRTMTLRSGSGFVLLAEAQAEGGVQRIDFLVDGTVVEQRLAEASGETPLQASFPWFSSGIGVHELSVVAYDARGRSSGRAALQVGVEIADISQIFPAGVSAVDQDASGADGGIDSDQVDGSSEEGGQAEGAVGAGDQDEVPLEAAGQPPAGGDNIDADPPPGEDAGQPPDGDQGEMPPVDFEPPPVLNPDGEVQDVEPPLVHLAIEKLPGEAIVIITATAVDNVSLNAIGLFINTVDRDRQPITFLEDCAEQPQCQIAPPALELPLSAGEWVFMLQAWDTSGNSSDPLIDQIEIICNQGDACAMANHNDDGWQPDIPPGAIINPVEMIEVSVISPPDAPSELTGLSSSCNDNDCTISLSWLDNSDNETGFKILRDGRDIDTVGVGAHQYLDRPVPLGVQHAYVVRAFNEIGESAVSNNLVILAGDRAVVASNLTASAWCAAGMGCEVALSWRDNSDNETGFRIRRDGEDIAIVEANDTDYLDRDVVRGEQLTYKVQVFNNSGPSAGSNEVVVIVDNVPRTPSNLTAGSFCQAPLPCFIELHWADNSDDEDGFVILRDGQVLDTQAADVTRYDDYSGGRGRQYAYTVKAFNGSGESPASNTVALGLGNASYSISGRVFSECPSEEEVFGTYQTCLTPIGPCFDTAGPACSPGTSHPYWAEGATIELSRCNQLFQRIPDGEFVWAGGPGNPCSRDNIIPISETRTDGNGRFSFDGLGSGIYLVQPIGFGEAGRFADHTDYALDYRKPIAYVGIRDQSVVVRFISVVAGDWPCGYLIERYGHRTGEQYLSCSPNTSTLEIP